MDEDNLNAQNKNAQFLLRHWPKSDWNITTLTYRTPDPIVAERKDTEIVRLWRRHGWVPHLFLRYLRRYDVVFYPGVHAADVAGLRWRRRLGYRAPVVATLEGLLGDESRQREYSDWAGHPVFCQHVSPEVLRCADEILQSADHVIAISPFLARMGKHRYGDKFSALPLGIDTSLFCPPAEKNRGRMRVVSAGRIELHKRPELFLTMAENFPQADFIWYGEGSLRHALLEEARSRKLENVSFPGSLLPSQLADEFRRADLFVMPSKSEGVPKVTQEAAACGLPMVLFGFFEAPSVINGDNGFVVWDDNEFFERVSTLVGSPGLCEVMGKRGAQMSLAWSWEVVAPQWEAEILNRFVQLKQLNGYEK